MPMDLVGVILALALKSATEFQFSVIIAHFRIKPAIKDDSRSL